MREDGAGDPQHPNLRESTEAHLQGAAQVKFWGGSGLSNGHRLLPAGHTNLGGQVLGEVPPSRPSLQEGRALTEGLSAVELPWEEQRTELEMTDRKGYGLYRVAVPRDNKDHRRL